MLLRVRSRNGTARVKVEPSDTIATVISQLGVAGATVSKEPAGAALSSSATISSLGLAHGDMLHASVPGGAASAGAPSSSAPTPMDTSGPSAAGSSSGAAPSGDVRTSRCRHSEYATCTFCASNAKSKDAAPKCLHGPGAVCSHCSLKDVKGTKLKWMCRHAADAKCPNCTKITKKWKKKKKKCTHPPHMKCPNCLFDGKADDEEESAAPAKMCQHGPNAMCENCLPKETEDEKLAARTATFRCRNHGPNGSCIECISRQEASKLKMKQQESANAKAASLDRDAANVFQNFVQQNGFSEHRAGIMYGRVEKGVVYVDVIYEPPQESDGKSFKLLEDPQAETVDQLASLLNLTRIGIAYTHPRRKFAISAHEVVEAAKVANQVEQKKFFVIVTISQNKQGQSAFEAFQLSDQTLSLHRQGSLDTEQDYSSQIKTTSAVIVEGSEVTEVDTNFLINRVAIRDHRTEQLRAKFPVENRSKPGQPPAQTLGDVAALFASDNSKPRVLFGDFHLLIFLTTIFDMKCDLPTIVEAVKSEQDETLDNYKLILSSHM